MADEVEEKTELEKQLESTDIEHVEENLENFKSLSQDEEVEEEVPENEPIDTIDDEEVEDDVELPEEYLMVLEQIEDVDVKKSVKSLAVELKQAKEYREENIKANKAILEVFDSEPLTAEIMKDILSGLDLKQAMAKNFHKEEILAAFEDVENSTDAKVKASLKDRLKAKKENEALIKSIEENRIESAAEQKAFLEESALPEKEAKELFSKIDTYLHDAFMGKISKDFYVMMQKAIQHGKDVETARNQGEIKARNEKIEVKKQQKKDDGLPKLTVKKEIVEPPKPVRKGMMAAIDSWERGQLFTQENLSKNKF